MMEESENKGLSIQGDKYLVRLEKEIVRNVLMMSFQIL